MIQLLTNPVAQPLHSSVFVALAGHTKGRYLVPLCLGQLSVLHHCFTSVGKAREGAGNGPTASTCYAKVLQLLPEFMIKGARQ